MSFSAGTLVKARGREWVVLPESQDDLIVLRPLGGTDDEVTGIYLPLERVEPASFKLPDPNQVGDHRSCRLLRNAVRLSSRATTGPFRSFARIAVEPRPYQLVPLLMALKLDPIRLLIADDVGVGKTIEACLIARELLDRGEVRRLAVLCPPHLAEQWQAELLEKFHIDAELVLRSTAARLERHCSLNQSLFDIYPHVVVSMDFIKSDRRRDEFTRTCPELVIVDEAHTCAFGYERRGGRHQRHQLIKTLAQDPNRHMIFVSATPHSGKEEAFRSLLTFLNTEFSELPEDIRGPENEKHRRRLAAHFVQRRRGDIRHFMQTKTPFPEREESEETYKLTDEYRSFFDKVLRYTREMVDAKGERLRQRVRWWSALALLRSVGSSPAAAAATLRNRSPAAASEDPDEVDDIGRRTILDLETEDQTEGVDITPGTDSGGESDQAKKERRRLLGMAREAEKLCGDEDAKLLSAVTLIKKLVSDGYHPIVFCRFIPTAEYLEREFRERLPNTVQVVSVTGMAPPPERESRVAELSKSKKRVLVCTECLSEGINLQEHFDAVLHYDLSWNPTRHEQREGRVDRFGQPCDKVRIVTYFGVDNPIDGIVLDVLVRKHKKIKSSLGISVPVPVNTDAVIESIFEGILLRQEESRGAQTLLPGLEEYFAPQKEQLHANWEDVAQRDKRSRTMFAQERLTTDIDEVARELAAARAGTGTQEDVATFTLEALRSHGSVATKIEDGYAFDLHEVPRALGEALRAGDALKASFLYPPKENVTYLGRTHPFVEALAAHVMDTAVDSQIEGVAARAGAIRSRNIARRTTLLLLRFRSHLITVHRAEESKQIAEECRLLAFAGAPTNPEWLDQESAESLLAIEPDENTPPEIARNFAQRIVNSIDMLLPHIEEEAHCRADELLNAHRRVRSASRLKGVSYGVEPQLPADILGIYVYLPVADKGSGQ